MSFEPHARYALYFAPEAGGGLWDAGARWLGRDAETGQSFEPLAVPGLPPARFAALTKKARGYGFHATLKAPFALRSGCRTEDLVSAMEVFARERPCFDAPALGVGDRYGYPALVFPARSEAMDALERDCVEAFDRFRAPLGAEDLARRRREGLSAEQEERLTRWGYPYVFEPNRFHVTLGDKTGSEERHALVAAAETHFRDYLGRPLPVRGVALFAQQDRQAPFRLIARFPFAA